jgi:hydrogenase maturation factor
LASNWYENQIPTEILKINSFLNLAAVDVDRIAREMDFQALQDNLDQITLCNIDAEIVSLM